MTILVPQFEELSSKNMYIKIKGYYESFIDYFPEYCENPDYIPPKRYLWDIFWTMDSDFANKFIVHSLKEKNLKDQEGDKTIEVSEDVLNQLHLVHYFSKNKGKALFMLTASKELGIIQKKRKKSFKAFNPSIDKEETKSRSKRSKFNEDSTNQRITDWLVEKKPKRKEKDENRLVERVNKNETEEGMNIDNESS